MMVSLRFSVALDKSSYSKNTSSSPSSIPSHVGRACVVNSLSRVTHVKSNKPTSEEISLSLLNTESLRSENRSNSKRNVGSRAGTLIRRNRWERELECLFVDNGDFDVDYSVIRSDLSLELCNSVLKRLGDEKALRFFDWMRNNGKLEGNITAYSFIFRVLCRKQDWGLAENLIEESKTQLDCQIFNALIYSSSKLGRADLGAKWFKAMLDRKIEPNAATYGMLMGLYRKSRTVVKEAEFTFSHMRAVFPMISTTVRSAYSAMITIYTRLGQHRKAEDVIELVRSDGVRPDSDIWLAMLNAYSQQGKLEEAEAVLVSMRESGFVPNIVAYNTLITGYGKASKIEEARRVFNSIEEVGLKPDETSYRSMIEGLGRAGDHDEAGRLYKKMKDSGFMPNSSNLFTMMNLQAKHGDEEGTAGILRDMLEIGCERASIVGVLVRSHEQFERIEKLPSIFRCSPWLRSYVTSNQTSCSVVVSAYVKNGLVSEALRVLKAKAWKDPGFEENLYHILICSCKEANRLENAVEIYSQFLPKKNQPNIHIACTMIDIFGSMGRFEEAERVYLELRSSGVALDMVGYTIVVRTFVRSGALDKASAAIDDMEKQTDVVSPDVYLLHEMFRLYQRRNDVEKLSRLYHKASSKKESRERWDKGMYECLINCCARAIPIDETLSLFQEMLRRGFVPNTVTVNVLLHLYGKAKMFRKAKKLFWLAEKWGLVDVVSYNTLISAYGKNNDLRKMSSAAKLMSFKGFSVSLEAYTSMLDAYGKGNDMESFREVLERMRDSGFGSNPYSYNIRINIYGKRGWIDEVVGVLAEMRECGARPDICGYNTLIKAYGIGGMVEEAVGVVREMREKGVEPDKITYLNLIAAAERNDEFLEAVKWSLWMKQMGL